MAVEAEELRPDLVVHSHGDRVRRRLTKDVDELSIDTIRTLAIDAVEAARSSHPGTPVALAPLGYVLFTRFMKHDPRDLAWPDRDRFVLSADHTSMLLYALLHLSGDDLPLAETPALSQVGLALPRTSGTRRRFGRAGDHRPARATLRERCRAGHRGPDAGPSAQPPGSRDPAATVCKAFGLSPEHVATRWLLGR